MAFKIAGSLAIKEAVAKAGGVILEPIMKVEVVVPEDYTGTVVGNLNSRRGMISSIDPRGNASSVNAHVPLSEMFGYATDIRGMTQGRGQFTMEFDHYAELPRNLADELIRVRRQRRSKQKRLVIGNWLIAELPIANLGETWEKRNLCETSRM